MKTYAPNESPKIEDVEVGENAEPIFHKPSLKWVLPAEGINVDGIWWDESERKRWDHINNFTYNPSIPPKPRRKKTVTVEKWGCVDKYGRVRLTWDTESEAKEHRDSGDVVVKLTGTMEVEV